MAWMLGAMGVLCGSHPHFADCIKITMLPYTPPSPHTTGSDWSTPRVYAPSPHAISLAIESHLALPYEGDLIRHLRHPADALVPGVLQHARGPQDQPRVPERRVAMRGPHRLRALTPENREKKVRNRKQARRMTESVKGAPNIHTTIAPNIHT
eukprot:1190191-Prorocentrum_minimum.AAC.1